jgi:membrane protease YdiL (CAAX protease family)
VKGVKVAAKPDFPFYDDRPVAISWWGWVAVLAATGLGFYLLTGPILSPFAVFPLDYIPALLFAGLPLLALHLVSKGHATSLFRSYGLKEFGLSIGFALLTIVTSFVVALLLSQIFSFSANPAGEVLRGASGIDLAKFLSHTFVQLIGEEVVSILPLLAALWFGVRVLRMPKGLALTLAVLVSTAWFAAMHLPTYNWNYVQCFAIIGSARLVLTASYLLTRNLWVSAGAHILNDWSIFLFTFAGSHAPIDAPLL